MVAREMFVAGECFVRLRPRRAEDGLLVPLQLQLLQSEMLPFEKMEDLGERPAHPLRHRVRRDRPAARLPLPPPASRRQHRPRRSPIPETVRVPASEVLHIYRPIDAGQIRGLPHVAPAMVRLFLLDQYDDAELDRKKTAAMFAGFITKTAPEEALLGETQVADDGIATASLEPGTLQVLLPGEDVKFSSPADVGGGYEAFQYRTLLAVSASLGLPYHLVTGDVRQANYSSLRAELVEFRRRVEQLQHGVIAHQLCRPIWARWMEAAVLAGALDLPGYASAPARWRAVQWIPPRWDWVDPLKDIQAQVLAIDAGPPVAAQGGRGHRLRHRGDRPRERGRRRPRGRARARLPHQARRDPRRAGRRPSGFPKQTRTEPHAILVCDPRPRRGRGSLDL